MAGIVVVNSKQEVQHQGIYLAMEGSVSLQLSAKSVGLFEAFYNSLKVHTLDPYPSIVETVCIMLISSWYQKHDLILGVEVGPAPTWNVPLPLNRMTDTCENITFLRTTYVVCNNFNNLFGTWHLVCETFLEPLPILSKEFSRKRTANRVKQDPL